MSLAECWRARLLGSSSIARLRVSLRTKCPQFNGPFKAGLTPCCQGSTRYPRVGGSHKSVRSTVLGFYVASTERTERKH